MLEQKQVQKSHYSFDNYMTKMRWISIWHQIDEIVRYAPERVLEIGPGAGVLKQAAALYGVKVETLDLDPELQPDHVGSATELPFADKAFDLTCAFQMLEHIPYDMSLKAFAEMARVAAKAVIISLPDAEQTWRYTFQIPKFGIRNVLIKKPFSKPLVHTFEGEHHWEINKKGYPLEKIIKDFSQFRPLVKTYRVPEFPYHRFFIFE